MITAKIEGAKEFSKAMKTAMMKTSKAVPVFLHDQAQRFMWEMYHFFHSERPTSMKIDTAVNYSLNSGKGIRVNKRNLARAKRIMGIYQDRIRERLGAILARKRINKAAKEKARELLKARERLYVRYRGHNKTIVPRAADWVQKRAKIQHGTGKQVLEKKMNLTALAARYEINRRHSGSGSMGAAFLAGYKQLRSYPLGSPFAFAQICKDKHTWANRAEMQKGKNILDLVLENKGFRDERPRNYWRVERVLKKRTNDLIAHANRVVKEAWKK